MISQTPNPQSQGESKGDRMGLGGVWGGWGVLPVRVVPTAADGLTAMSSHLRQAHRSRSIRLTPARDLTVCRRYLQTRIQTRMVSILLERLRINSYLVECDKNHSMLDVYK